MPYKNSLIDDKCGYAYLQGMYTEIAIATKGQIKNSIVVTGIIPDISMFPFKIYPIS